MRIAAEAAKLRPSRPSIAAVTRQLGRAMMVEPNGARAVATVQVDNERVRVTEWRFASGEATGWHRHAFDYVVVPLTTGTLRLIGPDGTREAPLVAGQSYAGSAGVEHDVVNINSFEFAFIEIELKEPRAR